MDDSKKFSKSSFEKEIEKLELDQIFYDVISDQIDNEISLGSWSHGSILLIDYEGIKARAHVMYKDMTKLSIIKTADALKVMKR